MCGWAYPLFCHLYWKVVKNDPNMISLGNGKYDCLSVGGMLLTMRNRSG